ncbi:MAG: hypothetical protein IKR76_03580 [Ruminococcus sp.]|nr:hypothetical protein [Ruminococcus sp.]
MAEQFTVTFQSLPKSLDELKALPEASLAEPQFAAALFVAAVAHFPENKEAAFEMIDFLRGPRPLSAYDKSFIKDRFMDADYVPRSYFAGSSPENKYTPDEPYTITFETNPYSYENEGYVKLWCRSSGADSPRDVVLRQQGSTGKYFLWEQHLLVGIRPCDDPWA